MNNHRIFSRSKTNNIAPANCKKHPKHKQSPGVCSLCVNEKLFKLSSSSRQRVKKTPRSASSSSSSDTSSDPSSCSSPAMKHAQRHVDSNALKSFGRNALKKSRSVAFVLTSKKEEKGIKPGFWTKLWTGKNKGLLHSRTTREKESLRVATVDIS